jgi:L-ascorbate metabolism protein UlaG (beta-lactamase superfamily)
MLPSRAGLLALSIACLLAGVTPAAAIGNCLAVAAAPEKIQRVGYRPANGALKQTEVAVTFIGHSTYLIETAGGVKAATDYNDYYRPSVRLDVVTMNRAHNSHYTDFPSPDILHVLRGWNPDGGPAKHDVTQGDMRVRNVPTNTRWGDTGGSYGAYGNSIFVFEAGGLCIGHLGHLHHTLTQQQISQIGQLDVVLVPVDGGYTMDVGGMVEVLRSLKARLILPMHYFNQFTLNRFLDRIKGEFPVEMADASKMIVSQANLPQEPKVVVLPGP